MTKTPPLLAHETLVRVMRIARFDGLSVLAVAGFFALVAASTGDVRGALVGVIIAAAGALELHGVAVLRRHDARGVDWLVGSQLSLLVTLLGYCAWRLTHVELEPLRVAFPTMLNQPLMQEVWAANELAGRTEEEFLLQAYNLTYLSLAIATLIYQGGMVIFYRRRRDAVTLALAEE